MFAVKIVPSKLNSIIACVLLIAVTWADKSFILSSESSKVLLSRDEFNFNFEDSNFPTKSNDNSSNSNNANDNNQNEGDDQIIVKIDEEEAKVEEEKVEEKVKEKNLQWNPQWFQWKKKNYLG